MLEIVCINDHTGLLAPRSEKPQCGHPAPSKLCILHTSICARAGELRKGLRAFGRVMVPTVEKSLTEKSVFLRHCKGLAQGLICMPRLQFRVHSRMVCPSWITRFIATQMACETVCSVMRTWRLAAHDSHILQLFDLTQGFVCCGLLKEIFKSLQFCIPS